MFHLTRDVRFAVNHLPDEQLKHKPANSYAGYPSLTGLGHYFELAATLAGELDPDSSYLINIKQIDQQVRRLAVPLVTDLVRDGTFTPERDVLRLFDTLRHAWPTPRAAAQRSAAGGPDPQSAIQSMSRAQSSDPKSEIHLHRLRLALTPFLSLSVLEKEYPMVRLSQKFEFAASHRLHNPAMTEEENRRTFGKCNNPHGHGHNYEVQVTLLGTPDDNGRLIEIPAFERIVAETIIDRFDHKNLNVEVPEFKDLIPSVENIAMVIHRLLKPELQQPNTRLASITVWETPKTWCEYTE